MSVHTGKQQHAVHTGKHYVLIHIFFRWNCTRFFGVLVSYLLLHACVVSPHCTSKIYLNIFQELDRLFAKFVVKDSVKPQHYVGIRSFTQTRNHINAIFVAKHLTGTDIII